MKVDAHQHFWQLQRKEYPWLTASLTAIYQDFGPEQLEPLLTVHKIDKTVLLIRPLLLFNFSTTFPERLNLIKPEPIVPIKMELSDDKVAE